MTPNAQTAIFAVEEKLIRLNYSRQTIKTYKNCLKGFLAYYSQKEPQEISKEEIETYLFHLVKARKIAPATQNQIINAIKFYYEKVLHYPRQFYNLQRPKKNKQLPGVLSPAEVKRIIQATANPKHRCMLLTIYAAGLRRSELLHLRIQDIRSGEGLIFIKSGKGRKDRYVTLSGHLLQALRAYYRQYRPEYWLFEGQDGGQYSATSLQKVFRRAVQKAGVRAHCTLHTLRHSYATHLVQQGVDLRAVQQLLGHNSLKTTQIYTHITDQQLAKIQSPLDRLFDSKT